MADRPVHWYEGMFLRPHHLQAADRFASASLRQSEDWFHPFNWGLRHLDLDRDAINNFAVRIRSCEARFKDGTRLSLPGDAPVDPVELKEALAARGQVTVYLAVPTLKTGQANVEDHPTAHGPRYWVETVEREDENTGGFEQPLQVRRTKARLLLPTRDASGEDVLPPGFEVLPLARIVRSGVTQAPPEVDRAFIPPILALDAWPPLVEEVRSLHHQIGARIELLASQAVGKGVSFDSQVPGDADRMLKLAVINGAHAFFGSYLGLRGLHPLFTYRELSRLVGQLAIFGETRRPPEDLPIYDHEDLGPNFAKLIEYIRLYLEDVTPSAFEKRYFEKLGDRLQVGLESGWLTPDRQLFLGVETELNEQDCFQLLDTMKLKLGSGPQAEAIFVRRLRGLEIKPVSRPPRQLPAAAGTVYFEIDRVPEFWRDVVASKTMGVRMNLDRANFQSDRMLAIARPGTSRTTNLQFALFII